MLGDALSAAGVVVAGVIIGLKGPVIADPLVSILISAMIFYGSWSVLKESLGVLLEAVPAGMDMAEVETAIRSVPGVSDAHDLHVWTIGPGVIACSCHIVVAEQSIRDGQQVRAAVEAELQKRFHINHSTLQVEVEVLRPARFVLLHAKNRRGRRGGSSSSLHAGASLTQV